MMDDRRPDTPPEPGEDPRVAAAFRAVVSRLTEPPDELTARRHLDAIRLAVHAPDLAFGPDGDADPDDAGGIRLGRRVLHRSAVAAVAAVVALVMLAGGGLLPDPAQQIVADTAHRIGVTLPQPLAPGELPPSPSDQFPAADEVDDSTEGTDTAPGEAGDESLVDTPELPAGQPMPARPGSPVTGPAQPPWDIDPLDRVAPRPGANPQHPAEPGPPVVEPPARVPTPTPGGSREPGPTAEPGKPGEAGKTTPRGNNAADSARDARRGDPPPPRGRHDR